jgi:hypothetical protein
MLLAEKLLAPNKSVANVGNAAGIHLCKSFRAFLTRLLADIPHFRETVVPAYGSNHQAALLTGSTGPELKRHGNNGRNEP